jgi:hypothetical protein
MSDVYSGFEDLDAGSPPENPEEPTLVTEEQADAPTETPKVEAEGEAAATEPAVTEAVEETAEEHEERTGGKKKGGYQRKIERLERELETLRAQISGAPQAQDLEAPVQLDDEPYEAYVARMVRHEVAMAAAQRAQADQEARAKLLEEDRTRDFQERWNETRASIQDFDSVMETTKSPLSQLMRDAILRSEMGPQLAYHLAKNVEVADQIASLTDPYAVALELGGIAAELRKAQPTRKTPPKTSSAPEPLPPTTGGRVAQPVSAAYSKFEEF